MVQSIRIPILLLLLAVICPVSHGFQTPSSSTVRRPLIIGTTTTTTTTTTTRKQQSSLSPLFFTPQRSYEITTRRNQQRQQNNNRSRLQPLFSSMIPYEELIQKLPQPQVIEAIENVAKKSVKGQVIASDVAAAAGISVSDARKELTALASLTAGDIAVNEDGELIYTFPENIQGVLNNNSLKYKVTSLARKAWPFVFWLTRVTFGVTLLVSLVAIFSAIFFIQTSSSSDENDNRRENNRGGGGLLGGGPSFYWGPTPFDFFYYRPYGSYGYYGTENTTKRPEDMGFFESIFSYVFGDGNPNANLEEKRLSLVANLIRENNGAVTAEQLAPYCDDMPSVTMAEGQVYADESYVLPIVTALNGEPQVTEDGDIIYVFSELQVSATETPNDLVLTSIAKTKEKLLLNKAGLKANASSREIAQLLNFNGISTRGIVERSELMEVLEEVLPPLTATERAQLANSDSSQLQEQEWQFTLASDLNKFLAGGLGIVNLGGALYLGNLLGQYVAAYGSRLPPTIANLQTFYPALLGYAILFNAIPAIRNVWINNQNAQIKERNSKRRNWKTALKSATTDSKLYKKLQAAKQYQSKLKQIDSSKTVFDTRQSIEEISSQKEQQKLQEFDKLLNNSNNDGSDGSTSSKSGSGNNNSNNSEWQ